jgi:transposase
MRQTTESTRSTSFQMRYWSKSPPYSQLPNRKRNQGAPGADGRRMMTAIFCVMRTGIQWTAIPYGLSPHSTTHDRFQEWEVAGLFGRLWQESLYAYDELVGIDWEWQAMGGAMTKAHLGGRGYRTEPNGPRQRRCQTEYANRWTRRPFRGSGGWSESTRYEDDGRHAGKYPD